MSTKNLVYTVLITAVICILGLVPGISLPFMPVPVVLQNIGTFLARVVLGRKYSVLSVIIFLLLAATSLPSLSGGHGGIGVFAGPSAGFLFLYPVVVYLIGLVRDCFKNHISSLILLISILVFDVLLLGIVGIIIMGFIMHMPISEAFLLSFTFIPGDIIKAIIASLVGTTLLSHSHFKSLM